MAYRITGKEDIEVSWEDLEDLIKGGDLGGDTQVRRDGETTYTSLVSRQEFAFLFPESARPTADLDRSDIRHPSGDPLICRECGKRLLMNAPLCPRCGADLTLPVGAAGVRPILATIDGGMYAMGHPAMPLPMQVHVGFDRDLFHILSVDEKTRLATMPRRGILSTETVDKSSVEVAKQVSLSRVALLGIWALALPKTTTKSHEMAIAIMTWQERGLQSTTVFRFEGPGSNGSAQSLAYFFAQARQQ